jgi:hypothetical protein
VITALWVAVFALVVVLEACAHLGGARIASLEAMAERLWRRPLGRAALLACWAFVGVHFLCRYTLPA